ncbi:hypothetical protein AYO38_07870 [bacterium SCGC AG-212-C10]|nr:hypothetical protein AYO38_07870 [bacterium SCGC AG-212-C10]
MALADVPAVVELERLAIEHGWEQAAYERELTGNALAHYLVLERDAPDGSLAGFGGFWTQVDETHIVTVAVAVDARRRGFASLLVMALIDRSIALGMTSATLEVRESNTAARALYRRFGFYDVGLRKRYYLDNNEDAVIMSTEAYDAPSLSARLARRRGEIRERFAGTAGLEELLQA